MTTYALSTASPRDVAAGLLIVPVFEGPEPGPGVKETRTFDAYMAARHTGKKGENLLVTKRRGDRFAADAVLLVGVGPRDAFDVRAMRRALGRAAGTARRFGTAATSFPLVFGARHGAEAIEASVEGL
ncbi:MAG TPA: M17 family peptidase N-terminal domain-containing protein, partial [Vicinamibacteria bacterium]